MEIGQSCVIEFFEKNRVLIKKPYCSLECQEKKEYERLLEDEEYFANEKKYRCKMTDQESGQYRVKKLLRNGGRTLAYKYI